MSKLPPNVVVKRILVTDLSQQLKKQRDFLKWMVRRHKETNPEQSEAFGTGVRILEELRQDLLDGLFDAEEEVLTEELTYPEIAKLNQNHELARADIEDQETR